MAIINLGLFKKKTSKDIVLAIKTGFEEIVLESDPNQSELKKEQLAKNLKFVKESLYGAEGKNQIEFGRLLIDEGILGLISNHIGLLLFEARKDACAIFNKLVKLKESNEYPAQQYIMEHQDILLNLLKGYSEPGYALHCGSMLKEAIKHDDLAKVLLYSEQFYSLFEYVCDSNFEIASDAFDIFKDLITRYSEFLNENSDKFIEHYSKLLTCKNCVTQRKALILLKELLYNRQNFELMKKYVGMASNMRILMNLLLAKSSHIKILAFHVFKIFVANPNKADEIREILAMNKQNLVKYFRDFKKDETDKEFQEDKMLIIETISSL